MKLNNATVFPVVRDVDSVMNQFIYRCSHDMLAPLKSISGLASIMERMSDENDLSHCLGFIDDSVKKMEMLLGELHKILVNNILQISVQPVCFQKIASDIVKDFEAEIREKNIDILMDMNTNVQFYSDTFRLTSMLHALISNAITFCDDQKSNRWIKIEVSNYAKASVVVIRDNGIGIEPELITRIYQPFFRGSEKSTGAGLGLFLVDSIVKQLGGSIRVSGKHLEGSAFTLWVPNLEQIHE